MNEITANVNNAHCMVTKNHVGYDTIMNICSGKIVEVPWTALDWVGAGFVTFFVVVLCLAVVSFLYMISSN